MVGSSHEAMHRIFQKDPTLLTRALQRVLHVPFPEPRRIAALNVDLTAEMILQMLQWRGIEVPDAARDGPASLARRPLRQSLPLTGTRPRRYLLQSRHRKCP